MNFVKNVILKMWILSKLRFSKWEFLDKLRIFAPVWYHSIFSGMSMSKASVLLWCHVPKCAYLWSTPAFPSATPSSTYSYLSTSMLITKICISRSWKDHLKEYIYFSRILAPNVRNGESGGKRILWIHDQRVESGDKCVAFNPRNDSFHTSILSNIWSAADQFTFKLCTSDGFVHKCLSWKRYHFKVWASEARM